MGREKPCAPEAIVLEGVGLPEATELPGYR